LHLLNNAKRQQQRGRVKRATTRRGLEQDKRIEARAFLSNYFKYYINRRKMQAEIIDLAADSDGSDDEEPGRVRELPVAVVLSVQVAQAVVDLDDIDNDSMMGNNGIVHVAIVAEDNPPILHVHVPRNDVMRGARNMDSVSCYLFEMIREDCTCTSVLNGWSQNRMGCDRVVNHCRSNMEQAFYVSPHGRTALHEACLRGSCRHVIQALLDANSLGAMDRDHHGNTPLHFLFVDFSSTSNPYDDIDAIVELLLAVNPVFLGACTNLDGSTALHMACSGSETRVPPKSLQRLLNANPSCASKLNSRHQTPLRLHCQRRIASTIVASILLQAHPGNLTVKDHDNGWAPLHAAASALNVELVQFLVDSNPQASPARTSVSTNQSALHLLCRQALRDVHLPAVNALLQADPDSVLHKDNTPHSYTPLHLLCRGSPRICYEIVQRVIATNSQAAAISDADQYLPLHHACEMGVASTELVKLLLQAYPDGAHATTKKQDSALSLACSANTSVEIVRLLIQANPSALTRKNDYGFAPLHCVCRAYQPRMGIVQALLEACQECVVLKTNAGETPVHLACGNSGAFVGVLQMLTMAQNKFVTNSGGSGGAVGAGYGNALDGHLMLPDKRMTNKVGNTPCKFQKERLRDFLGKIEGKVVAHSHLFTFLGYV
jgi:ankyrin repeat protein